MVANAIVARVLEYIDPNTFANIYARLNKQCFASEEVYEERICR